MRVREPISAPRQQRISVQDVRDYSSAGGAAGANEEMRRLALSIAELQDRADMPGAAAEEVGSGRTGESITIINNTTTTTGGAMFLCGIVTLNTYPSVSAPESFAREGAEYSPATGRYGRPVFGIIHHSLDLAHPDAFLLELTDVQAVSGGLHQTPQIFLPQSYGLDGNRILVRAVLKTPVELIDGELSGAPQFFFTLAAQDCTASTSDGAPGLVITGTDHRRWAADLDAGGTLRFSRTAGGPAREVILGGTGNARWRMEISAGGSLMLRRMPANTPATIIRFRLGAATATLSVDADGNLIVTRE